MSEILSGWGNYPVIESSIHYPRDIAQLIAMVSEAQAFVTRGFGRSYGDCSLSETVFSTQYLNKLIHFDHEQAILHCEAGVSLHEILSLFVPRGYVLPVMPGTSFVSIGGMIASDVHGKNHHLHGSFTDHVINFDLILPDGERIKCSRQENSDLFYATCGGMGLTGVIVSAAIKLIRIPGSYIKKWTVANISLEETMEQFIQNQQASYSVAWVDCLAKGKRMGRSLLMLGNFCQDKGFDFKIRKSKKIPAQLIHRFMKPFAIKQFNRIYYYLNQRNSISSLYEYFFPLDSIKNWNNFYGKSGFLQYQFVLPFEVSKEILPKIFKKVVDYGESSFLSTLKLFGPENNNYLSFPMYGYSMALDFPIQPKLFEFLNKIDDMVCYYGGRVYLTKDSRLSSCNFKRMYPRAINFIELRTKIGAMSKLRSLQSRRLGI